MEELTSILILFPLLCAVACYSIRSGPLRSSVVVSNGLILIVSSLALGSFVPFSFSPKSVFGFGIHNLIKIADFALMFAILYFGFKYKSFLIKIIALLQIALVAWLDLFIVKQHPVAMLFYCDRLSLVMVLIVSVVGSIICFQAIPYMKNHEEHLEGSRQPRFFFVMLAFLGFMNGLVLSNDLALMRFFFEATAVCSFLLIGHDGSLIARKNALRALWMNSLGCVAFTAAMILIYKRLETLDLKLIIDETGPGVSLLALALLFFAAFTKSAQFPFQSWLLGAMVAPTPVSALLHSSTMVKIGVYMVFRLAPAFYGTFLSQCLALFGAFSFLAAAALAIGQSNGKKVLAYSTVSNLGLIFACIGLNSPEAKTAAVLLIIFHAVIKALLFLCLGAIEQRIESRDIEDMRGLYSRMPLTALITVMGVILMIMPPFGLVLGKWMALEAAAKNIFVVFLAGVGSALTVMYWARWAGTLMSDRFAGGFKLERQPLLTWLALIILCAGAGGLSVASPWLYLWIFAPSSGSGVPYAISGGVFENSYGAFAVLPLCLVAALGFIHSVWAVAGARNAPKSSPYLSGIQTGEPGMFLGPMNLPERAQASNYYLSSLFGEKRLTWWINLGAVVLLVLILGGGL